MLLTNMHSVELPATPLRLLRLNILISVFLVFPNIKTKNYKIEY